MRYQYQWKKKRRIGTSPDVFTFDNIAGQTDSTYIINNVPASLAGSIYKVDITVEGTTCTRSRETTSPLVVKPKPSITLQPFSRAVCQGEAAAFTTGGTAEG
ncbi:MAG: hypothetical protein CRN43_01280, partial [Candidatus Nephrothrix sp. EaCA]